MKKKLLILLFRFLSRRLGIWYGVLRECLDDAEHGDGYTKYVGELNRKLAARREVDELELVHYAYSPGMMGIKAVLKRRKILKAEAGEMPDSI